MATKTKNDANLDFAGADEMVQGVSLADGEVYQGYYLGSYFQDMPMGLCRFHSFRGPNGARKVIIGGAILDGKLQGIKLGRAVQVTRMGRIDGKRVVDYEVLVHPTATLPSEYADDVIGHAGE